MHETGRASSRVASWALPPDWVRKPLQAGVVWVPRTWADTVDSSWFSSTRPDAEQVQEGGRQSAWFVEGPQGPALLRHYRRGGLRARFGKQAYFWLGESRVRAFREVVVLCHLARHQVRVPAPLAAACWRSGWVYRNAIIVRRIPGARPLASALDEASPEAVAAAVHAMHAAGVSHADLNAFNLLLDGSGQVWLIDFDRARLGRRGSGWREGNLRRLRRSLFKVAGSRGVRWWDALRVAYRAPRAP